MKVALTFFLLLIFSNSWAQYKSCSICIVDSLSDVAAKECQGWYGLQKSDFNLTLNATTSMFKKERSTCETVKIWGAFHGSSGMYQSPFQHSQKAAEAFSAHSVSYDGSTCLIFNNLEDATSEATKLAKKVRHVNLESLGIRMKVW